MGILKVRLTQAEIIAAVKAEAYGDPDVDAVADLNSTGLVERSGNGIFATVPISDYIKGLLNNSDASEARSSLGLGSIATQNSNAYLPSGGGTLTGDLMINKGAADAFSVIRSNAGFNRSLLFNSGTLSRWGIGANSTTESGSNVGSNFIINRYSDAGSLIDAPFSINRTSGLVSVGAGGLSVSGQVSANTLAVTGSVAAAGASLTGGQYLTIDNNTASYRYTRYSGGATIFWDIGIDPNHNYYISRWNGQVPTPTFYLEKSTGILNIEKLNVTAAIPSTSSTSARTSPACSWAARSCCTTSRSGSASVRARPRPTGSSRSRTSSASPPAPRPRASR